MTEEDKNKLDRLGIYYVESGGIFKSKFVTDIQIHGYISSFLDKHRNWQWGLIEAKSGNFLVADCYNQFAYMPITLTCVFAMGWKDQMVSKQKVVEFNKASIEQASNFYFAMHLKECPIAL